MKKVWSVARHEIAKHITSFSFIMFTLLLPLLGILYIQMVGIQDTIPSLNPQYILTTAQEQIASTDNDGTTTFSTLQQQLAQTYGITHTIGYVDQAGVVVIDNMVITPTWFVAFATPQTAQSALIAKTIDAYYVIPPDYMQQGHIVRYSTTPEQQTTDTHSIRRMLSRNILHHYDYRIMRHLDDTIAHVETVLVDEIGFPRAERQLIVNIGDNDPVLFVPMGFAILFFMAIFTSSSLLLHSMLEEKENRVLEILLTSLKPWHILTGKVIGLGMLGLLQILIWVFFFVSLIDYGNHVAFFNNIDIPRILLVLAPIYYLLGYLSYGGLMAGIGAVVRSTREGSVITSIISMPIIITIYLQFIVMERPNGMVAIILSIVPFSAPISMMTRLTMVDVVWYQIALSIVCSMLSVFLSIYVSARLFRTTLLLAGKKFNIRELLHALQASGE